jgi:hypothetical protein
MASRLFFWLPRILAILAILFMVMFSFDVFGGNEPFSKQLLGFFISNIPAIILIGVLIIAWKREVVGGIFFIIASIAGAVYFRAFSGNPGALIVMSPIFLVGILFIIHQVIADSR